jgi:phage terminase large subunit-like protein
VFKASKASKASKEELRARFIGGWYLVGEGIIRRRYDRCQAWWDTSPKAQAEQDYTSSAVRVLVERVVAIPIGQAVVPCGMG